MIEKILLEWGPEKTACTISCYEDNRVIGEMSIRYNNKDEELAPSGWQKALFPLDSLHKQKIPPDTIKEILAVLTPLQWLPPEPNFFGDLEIMGFHDRYKILCSLRMEKNAKEMSEDELRVQSDRLVQFVQELI